MRPVRTVRTYLRAFGPAGLLHLLHCLVSRERKLVPVARRWARHPLYLRLNTSDVAVFRQVFLEQEYAITARLPAAPDSIVDAGANIGLASAWLAERFPQARIWAVEPDAGNFELLERNTRAYGVRCVRGALWHRDEPLDLDTGLAEWAFQVRPAGAPAPGRVDGWRVATFLERHGLARVALLKLDIEGAEHEVLGDAPAWIGRVDAIVAELHETLRPGVGARFAEATRGFGTQARGGELSLAARAGA